MIETLIFISGAVVGSLTFSLMCAAKRGDEQASLALTVAVMSCVDVTPEMAAMLEALANDEPPDQYRDTPEWKNARAWGWVMESGGLTGVGSRHIPGERPRGILR
jgi:hypothetical protein